MISSAEREIVEALRSRYESEGYAFIVAPDPSTLPSFLGSYRPDAIAQKPGRNVAIEVTTRQSSPQFDLQALRRRFDGHPDWLLNVVFAKREPETIQIAPASPTAIRRRLDEARTLFEHGHHRAALVSLWSLLEAVAQAAEPQQRTGVLTPGTIVQSLVMNGLVDTEAEKQLRSLISLRNRIVHGDVQVEPAVADVELMLSIVDNALSAEAA